MIHNLAITVVVALAAATSTVDTRQRMLQFVCQNKNYNAQCIWDYECASNCCSFAYDTCITKNTTSQCSGQSNCYQSTGAKSYTTKASNVDTSAIVLGSSAAFSSVAFTVIITIFIVYTLIVCITTIVKTCKLCLLQKK